MAGLIKFASTLLLCMIMAAYVAEAAITCGTVTSKLAPCIPYATGRAPVPSSGCCSGVKSLNAAAKSTPDRQTACKCLKTLAGAISGVNYNVVGSLPGKCGVSIPYKISPSTDCNSVK